MDRAKELQFGKLFKFEDFLEIYKNEILFQRQTAGARGSRDKSGKSSKHNKNHIS